jgi:hypothetical protein
MLVTNSQTARSEAAVLENQITFLMSEVKLDDVNPKRTPEGPLGDMPEGSWDKTIARLLLQSLGTTSLKCRA